jgi:hypothetical protein
VGFSGWSGLVDDNAVSRNLVSRPYLAKFRRRQAHHEET